MVKTYILIFTILLIFNNYKYLNSDNSEYSDNSDNIRKIRK